MLQRLCFHEAVAPQSMAFAIASWDTKKFQIGTIVAIIAYAVSVLAINLVAVQSDTNGTRSLGPTLWGGMVTIAIIMFDCWTFGRPVEVCDEAGLHTGSYSRAAEAMKVFMPWRYILDFSMQVSRSLNFTNHMSRLSPQHTRSTPTIISGIPLVLGLSQDAVRNDKLADHKYCYIRTPATEGEGSAMMRPDVKGMLVIGRPRENEVYILLNGRGKEAMFIADLVPPREQTQFAQGFTGSSVLFTALQSIGYLLDVNFRIAEHLILSPIEVIGAVLSVTTVVRAGLHVFGPRYRHPLLLHLDFEEEQRFLEAFNSTTYEEENKSPLLQAAAFIFLVTFFVSVSENIYLSYISSGGTRSDRVSTLYSVANMFSLLHIILVSFVLKSKVRATVSIVICSFPMGVFYVLAILVTVTDWHKSGYDVRSNYSQILPHVG